VRGVSTYFRNTFSANAVGWKPNSEAKSTNHFGKEWGDEFLREYFVRECMLGYG
jgi:hypothetical protein